MYTTERYTITEVIQKSSRRYAERPALSMVDGKPIYYREIEPRTRRISATLGLYGIKKGDRVAILSENRPEWGLAYFGIVRAGAIAVPIMVDFTAEQIGNILRHSESKALVVSPRLLPKVREAAGELMLLSIEDLSAIDPSAAPGRPAVRSLGEDEIEKAAASFTEPPIDADELASIIYTSGTTGASKGVMLTHRNFVFDAIAARKFIYLRRTDRLLSVLPLAHAYEFTVGFIIPMLQGSAVYYLDRPPSATALLPALAAVRPTIMLTVPLIIEKIYRSSIKPKLDGMAVYKLPFLRPALEWVAGLKLKKTFGGKIRFFGIGGAPLAADVESFLHNARFLYSIGYGLTETAPLITGNKPGRVKLHTTGFPAADVRVRIADRRPDTGEGEIQVKGANVFPGYYKDPERTAEAFTPDGWFRTGDLGVMNDVAVCRITVRGRLKTMILGASGENIYPEEIEALLNASPYVLESLVYGDEKGLTALVHLKPEVVEGFTLQGIAARVKDRVEEAEFAAENLGKAAASAAHHAGESLEGAEKALAQLLESIKREANARLAGFSRLARVEHQPVPFEKTPKQSIKRFLYPMSKKP
jgi:long-chain acyl-CoA synthetase